MSNYAAQLLDELMGKNRDVNPGDKSVYKTHWSDSEVCKNFLCGFCPNDLFTNTRVDLGKCEKLHDEELKRMYMKSTRFEKMGYENELFRYLQNIVREADRRVERGQERLNLNKMQASTAAPSQQILVRNTRIEQITQKINELLAEAEAMGCEGNVDQAQQLLASSEHLKQEKEALQNVNRREQMMLDQEVNKAMEVCPICGALLIIGDIQQRQEEHLYGKQHVGYAKIRSYLDSIKEKMEKMMKLEPLLPDLKRNELSTSESAAILEANVGLGDNITKLMGPNRSRSRSRSVEKRTKHSREREKYNREDSSGHKSAERHRHAEDHRSDRHHSSEHRHHSSKHSHRR